MFWQVVDKAGEEGNYLETSGSAMIAYAMMKGARLGYADKRFAALGERNISPNPTADLIWAVSALWRDSDPKTTSAATVLTNITYPNPRSKTTQRALGRSLWRILKSAV